MPILVFFFFKIFLDDRGYLGAIGGAIRLDDEASFIGELSENGVDVGAMRETVAAILPDASEDVGGDCPSLPLPHLRLLPLILAPLLSTLHLLLSLLLCCFSFCFCFYLSEDAS